MGVSFSNLYQSNMTKFIALLAVAAVSAVSVQNDSRQKRQAGGPAGGSDTSPQGILEQAAGLVGADTAFGQLLTGRAPSSGSDDTGGSQTMAMSMNQIGSNYFVQGDFVIPQGCAGCAGTVPEDFDISSMGPGSAQGDQSFGMNMSQMGSNYFVMGDYLVGDTEFLTYEAFIPCLDISGLEGCAVEMQQSRIFDCVIAAELARRQDSMLPTDYQQPEATTETPGMG